MKIRWRQQQKIYQQADIYGLGTKKNLWTMSLNEESAKFSPVEEDISVGEEELSTPRDGQNDISCSTNDFSAYLAEDDYMAGWKRSQKF